MIDLPIIISTLSLGVEIGVGTSDDCKDCVMGGEGVELLRRFFDLWWGWRRRIGFGLDLRVGVVWHWICDLWHCRRICYLCSWRGLWMIGYGIVVRLIISLGLDLIVLVGLHW
jgi:hypothetical protein